MSVELTDEGIRCAKAVFIEGMAVETDLVNGLSQAEQDQLAALLGKLIVSITA